MKQVFFILLFSLCSFLITAQIPVDSTVGIKPDTTVLAKTDSNTLLLDSLRMDPVVIIKKDTVVSAAQLYYGRLQKALGKSSFLNTSGTAAGSMNQERQDAGSDLIFYFLLALLILLAFLRFFFSRYLSNLFRVFFNTSLRQSQLTDQLLQAKQPSMFFNILFFFIAGIYIYFLLLHFNWLIKKDNLIIILICSLCIATVYFLKYINMKFTGWLTGYSTAANNYLFIIFLINKILGILLIPFVIVIAFSPEYLKKPAVIVSLLMVGIMFLLRYIRSFSLLHRQIKVSRFHFFLYIAGIEILPVLLIYKGVLILLDKNL